ncbi:MAG: protoporphyrinogen oxidase [Ilumatobacteraceae bacterium]
MSSRRTVAVVGGGMAGLSAAYELAAGGADVVVIEGTDRVGGKLRLGTIAGLTVDLGAESILARRPEALELVREIGLADRIVHPNSISASIWTRGALRPMPPTVQGVPADLDALRASGILAAEIEQRLLPMPTDDISVAEHVSQRLGREVVDRLIEPLLGGVYAGHADRLSLRATSPQIAALGPDLLAGAVQAKAAATATGPVFFGLVGGVGQLPEAVVAAGGFEVRLDTTVRAVARTPDGWRLTMGPTTAVEVLDVDAVVMAAPAPAAARLLADAAPAAAFALAGVDYASMAIVTFVLDGANDPGGSGFLVPAVDDTFIKAATYSSNKWGWSADQAAGLTIARASVGRAGETTLLHHDDASLIEAARADLERATGGVGRVVEAVVHRWGGALPQYDVGHLDLVDTVERSVAEVPGLEVCGAAYRGVGIPAVIGSGRAAARRLLDAGTLDA